MKESYQHPVIGEITINRSPKARRLSLSVRPCGVTLTFPLRFPLQEALAFAESKQDWIEKAKARAEKRIKPPVEILPPFRTRLHTLEVIPCPNTQIKCTLREGVIRISHPLNLSPRSEAVQAAIRQAVTEAYRIEAKLLLPQRVDDLAHRFGFRYGGLSFRNAVSRWGSCSGRNAISLSIHLMILPDHLMDYVILHELCHTRHKNHGPKFHALLDQVTAGRHAALNKELRNYTPRW